MPTFEYKAKSPNGSISSGTIIAESVKAVLNTLDKQGLYPLELKSAGEKQVRHKTAKREKRITKSDVITFTREIADLLRAGVPINKALASIQEHTSNTRLQKVIEEINRDISQGSSLAKAMSKHSALFPDFYIGIIRAGEKGGFLEEALDRIALFSERDEELKGRIKSALAYPILLLIIGCLSVAFLLTFFIPRFAIVIKDFGKSLPEITLITIAISEFLRDYFLLLIGGAVGLYLFIKQLKKQPKYRFLFDKLKLKTPVVGELSMKRSIAIFTRTLGTLLKSGVPMIDSLIIAKDALSNSVLARDIEEAGAGIKRGEKLGQILRKSQYFPAPLTDAILIGEESGKLDSVLINAANSYDAKVDRLLKTFVSLFEPILIVIMAAIVGFVVISMLLPVFTLSTIVR